MSTIVAAIPRDVDHRHPFLTADKKYPVHRVSHNPELTAPKLLIDGDDGCAYSLLGEINCGYKWEYVYSSK